MQVGVIATPDVHSFDLTERDHFIILGCDGLWGVSLFVFLLSYSYVYAYNHDAFGALPGDIIFSL